MSRPKLSSDVQRTLTASLPLARYRHTWEFKLGPRDCERTTGLSMAVPNEHLDLAQMAERYRRTGTAIDPRGSMRAGVYGDDDLDGDDLEKVSQSDIIDQVEHLSYRRAMANQEKAENAEKANSEAEARKTSVKPEKESPAATPVS